MITNKNKMFYISVISLKLVRNHIENSHNSAMTTVGSKSLSPNVENLFFHVPSFVVERGTDLQSVSKISVWFEMEADFIFFWKYFLYIYIHTVL